jgi:hypothetical protein
LIPADEWLANDSVGADFYDRDVGDTIMRSADFDRHRDCLAGSVVEDLTSVREGNTLALPHAAVGMGTLKILKRTLNISVVVRELVIKDLVTAGSLEAISWHAGCRAGDVAMGGNGGNEASNGSYGEVGLHIECVLEKCSKSVMEGWLLQRWYEMNECLVKERIGLRPVVRKELMKCWNLM